VSKAFRTLSALGAVFFALLGLSACGGVPSDAVVQVGSTPISKTAFEHWMQVAAVSSKPTRTAKAVVPVPPAYSACIANLAATSTKTGQSAPTHQQLKSQCETQYKALRTEVMGFLIDSQWVLAEADRQGVKVSDEEVHKQFLKIKSTQIPSQAEFERFLVTSGQTVSDLLLRVKLQMLSMKIQQKIIKEKGTVSQQQIEAYYNQNKSRFGTPEKRNVSIILTKGEAEAAKAKKEVESGKSFSEVAKAASIDPATKANGGSLPEVTKGEEEAALDAAIFSASPNVLSGPVKTPFGYYVFTVHSVTPGTQQSLAEASPSIKAELTSTQEQEALSKFVKEFRKRWTSETDCQTDYVVADCKQYKAPKGTTTTSPTGAG